MSSSKPAKDTPLEVDPTGSINMGDIPSDAVVLLVWRRFSGAEPFTIIVTPASWVMNKQVVVNAGFSFDPERIYEFESPPDKKGRKTIFHLQDVIGWAANVHTGQA